MHEYLPVIMWQLPVYLGWDNSLEVLNSQYSFLQSAAVCGYAVRRSILMCLLQTHC